MQTINTLVITILAFFDWNVAFATNLRSQQNDRRALQSYYHTLTTEQLGVSNPDAAIGNPLKGLMESPIYTWPPYKADIPLAVEFYYIGKAFMSGSVQLFDNPLLIRSQFEVLLS